jgi:hypothetical protein
MSLLSKLNRVCWGPLRRALLQAAVTGAALAVLVVVLALSGPGAADASSARPLGRGAHHSRSEGERRKPARGARGKPACAHAKHCKRVAGHSPLRDAPASRRSSEEEAAATGVEATEEEALESGLAEEGSSEEVASAGSSAEAS